jgi:mono/diheme cytochrome c family protein
MRTVIAFAFTAVALAATGCSSTDEPVPTTEVPTYHADVAPIVIQHCAGCHQDGGIGQGVLTSFADVAARGTVVRDAVVNRTMPPWLAGDGCNDYLGDPSLSDEDIATIERWVDAGMPEGDPASEPDMDPPAASQMSRVDHTMMMPEEYVPSLEPDDYRCFLMDWPETNMAYVTGLAVRPGNATTVHHVIAYVAAPGDVAMYQGLDDAEPGPGYTCYGGPGGGTTGQTGFLGGWAPGGAAAGDYPAGTGIPVEPGSKVILQVHYNMVTWDGTPDRTEVDLKVDHSVDREASFAFFADPGWAFAGTMNIPAGEPDVVHSFTFDPTSFLTDNKPFDIYGVILHMHTRGTSATLDMMKGGDEAAEQCLLDIPRWDFNWQNAYRLEEPVLFEPGDQLRVTCHWNNSAENQPIVDGMQVPPKNLNWGEGTGDEMCLGTLYLAAR